MKVKKKVLLIRVEMWNVYILFVFSFAWVWKNDSTKIERSLQSSHEFPLHWIYFFLFLNPRGKRTPTNCSNIHSSLFLIYFFSINWLKPYQVCYKSQPFVLLKLVFSYFDDLTSIERYECKILSSFTLSKINKWKCSFAYRLLFFWISANPWISITPHTKDHSTKYDYHDEGHGLRIDRCHLKR